MTAEVSIGCLGDFHDFCESLSRAGVIFCRRCGAELVLDTDTPPRIFLASEGATE